MIKKIVWILFTGFFFSFYVHAERLVTLNDIYSLALQQDPNLKIADATRLITSQNLPLAISTVLPKISADASQFSERRLIEFIDPESNFQGDFYNKVNNFNLNLDHNLLAVSGWFNIRAAKKEIDSADATYLAAQQDLIGRVFHAYFDVLYKQDILALKEAEHKAIAKELQYVEDRFEVGLVPYTDVQNTTARYDLTVAAVINARNSLENAIENLKIITGPFTGNLATLQDVIPLKRPEPADMEEWVITAEQTNPTLIAARYSFDASKEAVRSAKAELLPTVNLSSSWGQGRFNTFTNPSTPWRETWSVFLTVGVNLFNGGYDRANIRKSQYTALQSQDNLELILRQTLDYTRNSYRDVITNLSEVNAFHQAVISARASLDATQAAYEVGTRTILDVLNGIANLYQQQQNYASARYAYIISTINLKQSTGVLSIGDVLAINELLNTNSTNLES